MRLGVSCIKKRNVAKETCSKTEELCLNMVMFQSSGETVEVVKTAFQKMISERSEAIKGPKISRRRGVEVVKTTPFSLDKVSMIILLYHVAF